MAKYGCGLTSADICRLEVKEMREILGKYNVSDEDTKELVGMVQEGYFQLSQSYKSSKAFEKAVKDKYGEETLNDLIGTTVKILLSSKEEM